MHCYRLSVLPVLFLALFSRHGSAQSTLLFNPVTGHHYVRFDSPLDWFAAQAAATASTLGGVNGYLATITSQQENDLIASAFPGGGHWLGGFQPPGSDEPAGGWQWVTGEPWDYTAWAPFEPNNFFGTEDGLSSHGNGQWNDLTRTVATPYLVEYPTTGALFRWANSAGGDLADAGNWSSGYLPGANEPAIFDLGSTGYVVTAAASRSFSQLSINSDNVTLDLGASVVGVVNALRVAHGASDVGLLEIASGVVSVGNGATVGGQGSGTLIVNGAFNVAGNALVIADAVTSTGNVAVTAGGSVNVTGQLFVGVNGDATMAVYGPEASLVTAARTSVGYESGSAILIVEDNAQASFGEALIVGVGRDRPESGAHGEFIVRTGAIANVASLFTVGGFANSSVTATGRGKATISGGSVSADNQAQIGLNNGATGELLIEDGGILSTSPGSSPSGTSGTVGVYPSSYGLVRVTGSDSKWVNAGLLTIGSAGVGEVLVEEGGLIQSARGQLGRVATAEGSVTVAGTGSRWNVAQDLSVGGTDSAQGGQGMLTVSSGGRVNVGGSGMLRVWASGTVDVSGLGAVDVGYLVAPGAAGNVTLGGSAVLRGDGLIRGNVDVRGWEGIVYEDDNPTAIVAPGGAANGIGRLTIDGNYTQNENGVLQIQLAGPQQSQHDQLFVTGHAALGSVTVSLTSGFVPVAGDAFKILDWSSRSGTLFATAPTLPGGLRWNTKDLYASGVITVSPAAQQIARWTFEAGTSGNPPSATGTTIDNVSPASGSGVASGFHASSATVWDNPAGNGTLESMSSNNWAIGDYYQFRFSTVGMQDVTLSFEQVSSTSGPRDFQLQYSTDGDAFTNFGTPYAVRANTNPAWSTLQSSFQDNFSFNLSSVQALNDQANVYLRLVVASNVSTTGGVLGSGGTSRLDNVIVSGTTIVGLAGDYNDDGVVDGADFLAWQRQLGTSVAAYSGADGNGDGVVDAADFVIWRERFGNSVPAAATASAAVPEPSSLALLCLTIAIALRQRRRPQL